MNQILSTNNLNNEKKNKENKHNDYNNTGAKSNNKKIIIIFAIIVLIFGVILGIIGIKKYLLNNKNVEKSKPEVTMERMEEGVALNIKSEYKIKQVSYHWNEGDNVIENINDSSIYSKMIEPDNGDSTLYVTVTDEYGKAYEYSEQFYYDVDKEQPKIEYGNISEDEVGKKVMKVIATDETEMDYIIYKWNDEDEIKVPVGEDKTRIEAEIEILEGNNTLNIKAKDKAGNEKTTGEIPVKGLKKPEINVVKTGNIITITITHEVGIKKVKFTINESEYYYDESSSMYEENKKTLEIPIPLQDGENNIIIKAESVEGIESEYIGKCTYEP